ncbi:MAG: hypothetical protein RLY21_536 [Planctomycetota bacterium]|jgi:hypothetical protein
MKFRTTSAVLASALALGVAGHLNANPDIYIDATGDVSGGVFNPNGILDLVSLEVSNTATDVMFKLTVNSGASFSPDWGKYMIGIAGGGASSSNGNGWGRPINMDSANGGMTRWIGSWVDGGGGAQLWSSASGSWIETNATYSGNFGGFSIVGNTVTYTVSLASLGLNVGDTFYFDAYSSGGGGGDGAIDALANPGQSVANWGDIYTSGGSNPIFSYTVVPAPAAFAVLGAFGLVRGRRSRKG